ncbi:hypothetical protein DN402_34075 [Streptomyces sp. SW4]|nr:hypothetical protein DN402_34075 [Streptomyces sp. SW4]
MAGQEGDAAAALCGEVVDGEAGAVGVVGHDVLDGRADGAGSPLHQDERDAEVLVPGRVGVVRRGGGGRQQQAVHARLDHRPGLCALPSTSYSEMRSSSRAPRAAAASRTALMTSG